MLSQGTLEGHIRQKQATNNDKTGCDKRHRALKQHEKEGRNVKDRISRDRKYMCWYLTGSQGADGGGGDGRWWDEGAC